MQVQVSGGAGKMGAWGGSSPDSEEERKAVRMVLHSNSPLPADNRILEQMAVLM